VKEKIPRLQQLLYHLFGVSFNNTTTVCVWFGWHNVSVYAMKRRVGQRASVG